MQCSGLVLRRQLMQYGNHHLPRAGAEPFLLQHKPGAASGSTEVHKIASSGSGRFFADLGKLAWESGYRFGNPRSPLPTGFIFPDSAVG